VDASDATSAEVEAPTPPKPRAPRTRPSTKVPVEGAQVSGATDVGTPRPVKARTRTGTAGTAGTDATDATDLEPGIPEPNGDGAAESPSGAPKRRRRRRGGRGRGKKKPADATGDAAADGEIREEGAGDGTAATADGATGGSRASASRGTRQAVSARPKDPAGSAAPRTRAPKTPAAGAPAAGAALEAEPLGEAEPVDAEGAPTGAKKRRRRGGRGRGKRKSPAAEGTEATKAETAKAPAASRRSRAARSEVAEEAPAVSTRLRRSRQTRTTTRRRREPMPIVPRVTDKLMVITEHGERDQIAVLEGRELVQHYVTRIGATSMVGNVYLGRVQNVLPGMEAAFVDVGRGRNAVLYAGEVNWSAEDLEGAPQRIEHVLKSGQSVLVQVTKDPIGGKGARLTAQISMPGRYLVLAPNSNVTGISRRLPDDERRRLKTIYKKIKPDEHGLIVRTAAEGASEEALDADLGRLLEEWNAIEKRAKKAKAPSTLYEEPELTVRVVRDLFTDEEYRELATDSPRVYEIVTDYLRQADPDLLAKVRLHDGRLPVFEEFHVVEQIHKGLDRKVWLPSGGYLVIDRTEALTVIDVNTGKSVGKTNLEETVVNTNLEAASEVARQLRLRDIGGMIVIDFIDMLLEQNKKKVIDGVKEALAQDKSRSQVFDISPLGLLEVTRKRVSGGLLESFSETCPTCEGRGVLLTYDVN
jgi:ribonuclease E